MTDTTYETESHHTPESLERDARFVGHDEAVTSKERVERHCAKIVSHVSEGRALWDSDFGGIIDTLRALLAERDILREEAEGALAIIAVERAEVIKLREENERLRGTLVWVADVTSHSMGLTKNEERAINKVVTSALKGEQP